MEARADQARGAKLPEQADQAGVPGTGKRGALERQIKVMPVEMVARHQIILPAAVAVVLLLLASMELQLWVAMVVPVYLLQLPEQEPQGAAAVAAQHTRAELAGLAAQAVAEMLA